MLKGEIINGYLILEDFVIAGGQSKISFAKKNGEEYFIKEFLKPKFPIEGAPGSEKIKEKKIQDCLDFEKHHKVLKDKISSACSTGGNLVYTVDFFREGTSFYKINEKIDVSSISIQEIAKLSIKKKYLILKTICHSLGILHSHGIVHGDLKPDNILIKKTETGVFTTKLIDFDDSYFSKVPPLNNEIIADPSYYSPELGRYIMGGESTSPESLTVKSDVYTLGIVFCQYLTGKIPYYNTKKYEYAWEAVNDKQRLDVNSIGIKGDLGKLLNATLVPQYNDRPSVRSVFENIKRIEKGKNIGIISGLEELIVEDDSSVSGDDAFEESGKSELKGKLLGILDKKSTREETGSKLKGKLLNGLDKKK